MTYSLQSAAVIFDMDGLMFDTERIGFEAFCLAARMQGYKSVNEFFINLIGRTVDDADLAMKEEFGSDFPIAAVRRDRLRYISEIRNMSGIPMKEGLLELLDYLKERNIPLAVASSSKRAVVEENLNQSRIRRYFRVLVCGDEITQGKPHPEIYLKTADRLSISPSKGIVLEDSLLGIAAAHAARMTTIMVPDLQKPTPSTKRIVHRIFPSLHDVRTYFESTT